MKKMLAMVVVGAVLGMGAIGCGPTASTAPASTPPKTVTTDKDKTTVTDKDKTVTTDKDKTTVAPKDK